jgi:hypothetical protein
MPERIAARLRAELDAIRPGVPNPAAARYRAPRAARAWRPRLAGYGLAGALGAALMAGGATVASGSPNPEVWTMQVAGGIHRLQEPAPVVPTPAAPAATDVATQVVAPRPAPPAGEDGHGRPEAPPQGRATPEPRESPEPAASPGSQQGRPAATAKPSDDSRDGGGDGGRAGSPSPRPSPSPDPSER